MLFRIPMDNNVINCVFCQKFDEKLSYMVHPIFDKIIWKNESFVLIPAKGSLVEGYLLIIPIKHYYSLADLPPNILSNLSKIKSIIRRILTEYFTRPIFFEHGALSQTNLAGSSIRHAHLHCVPFQVDLTHRLQLSHRLRRIDKFEDIANQLMINQSYIYFENQDQGKFIFDDVSVPSQYLRRVIAEELGISDQWDYAIFPFEQKVISTLKVLDVARLDMLENF